MSEILNNLLGQMAFMNPAFTVKNLIMIAVALFFMYLAIVWEFEPLLLLLSEAFLRLPPFAFGALPLFFGGKSALFCYRGELVYAVYALLIHNTPRLFY